MEIYIKETEAIRSPFGESSSKKTSQKVTNLRKNKLEKKQ